MRISTDAPEYIGVFRTFDEEIFEDLSQEAREEVAQMELQLSLCTVEEKNPEEEKENFRDSLKMLETILETRTLTPLDIATLIDHIEVHETDVLGPYRAPEMELTIYWNILEFGELLEGMGEMA